MNPGVESHCRPERLELFLADQLNETEEGALEAHLETCADCRKKLDRLAAPADDWLDARRSLTDVEFPPDDRGDSGSESGEKEPAPAAVAAVLASLAPSDDPRRLGRLGNYEVAGVIGCGGMSVVLKAFDPSLNRFVAVKVLAPHLAMSAAARKRFGREAQAAAAVVHDNVVAIHGVAEFNHQPYFVMPYIRGASLQKRIDECGALGVAEVLRVGTQVAGGLAAAHAQGLVHRDIKPANIMLEDGVERLKITDFGLARAADDATLTRSGVVPGTPEFMSPEQARGETVDHRSDLFSLGSVLYMLCTGRPPFRAETSYGVLRRITDSTPRPIREINPEVPVWLVAIIEKLHAKAPAERYESAGALAQELEQCLAHVQQPDSIPLPRAVTRRASQRPRSISTNRRNWYLVGAAAIVLVACVGALVLLSLHETTGNSLLVDPPSNPVRSGAPVETPSPAWEDGVDHELEALEIQSADLQESASWFWDEETQNDFKESSP